MAEGRGRAEWGRTASIMALMANVNRDPRKRRRPFEPDYFIPAGFRRAAKKAAAVKAPLSVLRDIFCRKVKAVGR
jgi:hypothetical protein